MIIIVDFGSQTAHLIGRRLRQLGVQTEYVEPAAALELMKSAKDVTGVIFSGGPASVYVTDAPTVDPAIFQLGLPILGICYGWQLIAHLLGGEVKSGSKEYGLQQITIQPGSFDLKVTQFQVVMSHGDSVMKLPPGFELIGSTNQVQFTAVQDLNRKFYGLQFHPEVDHTEHGMEILQYFIQKICGEKLAPLKLNPQKIIDEIAVTVGDKKVICAVSGGVDSTIAAALIGKAIGTNLIPVYVDSGLMRPKNRENVEYIFSKLIPAKLVVVEARPRFMAALNGVTEPEEKRKIIGKLYVDIFQEQAEKFRDAAFLGQGTIYSDVIESKGSKHASKIKSHHNVGGLPKDMKFQLVEPIRNYYKDEVREIGRLLGLPEETIMQQPMPGPGHAINVRGEVTEKRLSQVILANEIVVEELKKAGIYEEIFEAFAVMTGAFSTAVKGDERAFAEVIAVRAIDTKDLMTVQWSRLPYEVLASISNRIVNEVPDVSRVVYDITSKPPATVRWE